MKGYKVLRGNELRSDNKSTEPTGNKTFFPDLSPVKQSDGVNLKFLGVIVKQ